MTVSGFTFLRNGVQLAYPFVESIQSALPLCDEFIVALGDGQDNSREKLEEIGSDKIRIIPTCWNESMVDRGYVYAQQKMIAHFNCSGDWAFYLEGDEILHEKDIPALKKRLTILKDHPEVEAIVFDYHHFFGSPEWVTDSPGWYRRAPRIIRNNIRSYAPDGLFFVIMDENKKGRYPQAALANAPIYHYGHVRKQDRMAEKVKQTGKYWGHENYFNLYQMDPRLLKPFEGEHPQIIQDWLATEAECNFQLPPNYRPTRREQRHWWLHQLEKSFNLDLSKKHYRLLSV